MKKKVLIIRLSSLGDVVLATSALEAAFSQGLRVDFLVAKEFAPLVSGHPAIQKLWVFDRKEGLSGWLKLCQNLKDEEYTEIYDLHLSLRTFILRWVFYLSLQLQVRWIFISKQRWRLIGYFLFKACWPKRLRPASKMRVFAEAIQPQSKATTCLQHLLKDHFLPEGIRSIEKPFFSLMPASKWRGKEWPVSYYFDVAKKIAADRGWVPVVLGSAEDQSSQDLVESLKESGLPVISGVGDFNLLDVAVVIAHSKFFLGNDTGLAHIAEALQVPSFVIFGPTKPDMGFGPVAKSSVSIEAPLGCRPCGKDGRYCYRIKHRYLCMTQLLPQEVLQVVERSSF